MRFRIFEMVCSWVVDNDVWIFCVGGFLCVWGVHGREKGRCFEVCGCVDSVRFSSAPFCYI